MIFTSATAPFRTSPSTLFKEKGDQNGFPGTCIESKIIPLVKALNPKWSGYIAVLPFVAAANVTGATLKPKRHTIFQHPVKEFLPSPAVGLSFKIDNDGIVQRIKDLGFIEDTNGRVRYYRGTPTVEQLGRILDLDPQDNTFVPAGVCDLEGYKAHVISSRVISSVLTAFGHPNVAQSMNASGTVSPMEDSHQNYILRKAKKAKSLPGGHFFPYFHGLLTPDKESTADIIIRDYYPLLGEEELSANLQTLKSGWSTLAATPSGLIMQHMFFLTSFALQFGMRPYVFLPGGRYAGMVLATATGSFLQRGKLHEPKTPTELMEELKAFDSHDDLLEQVAGVINTIPLAADEASTLDVHGSFLRSPRLIHNLLRSLKITPETRILLSKLFHKLSFEITPLDPRNASDLIKVFVTAKSGEYLDDDAPMFITDEAMFTKEADVSAFAAFGAVAPSLFDPQGTALSIIKGTKSNKEIHGDGYLLHERKTAKGDLLVPSGRIPVFVKNTQQAVSDFRSMTKAHAISFRLTARGGAAGASYVISKSDAERISVMLARNFAPAPSTEKKRERNVSELTPEEIIEMAGREAKRRRKHQADKGLWASLGTEKFNVPDDDAMDAD